MKHRNRRKQNIRRIIQIGFFTLVLLITLSHSYSEVAEFLPVIEGASLHAVCPFGGVVSLYRYVTTGTFVQKIHDSSFYLMLIVFVTAIIAGPVFCGWICPFGTFQEWIGMIGRTLFKKRYNRFIPSKIDRYLRFIRYILLIWIVVSTALSATLVFSSYDPYYALFNLWTSEVAISAYIILAVVIIASLFVERPFCKYACPYGALLGLTNYFRIFKIHRKAATCIDCGKCDVSCPMNITISTTETVKHPQCITCMLCTSEYACPVKETVYLGTAGKETTSEGTNE
ncbi:MAG: 4Fe-4S binding protein [Sphaerochaetaceae bacterium]|nr:4Fe-4S binding protein [Sphaerochaetaceae bacterium]MDD2405251.1 4Fe-4S binding protein [Sphaerochaetaceae bacterium]MDD4259145.1 4Fe-4S binding protein [Sphaerochaetaceae bacterium]MDD4841455.1 4Fe-4S binding protein [Sphaerochaetaceae bacterium]NLO59474.1 4Fe-4S binding protein [Spirochaetales bacterium]